jgi:hypothetical protein
MDGSGIVNENVNVNGTYPGEGEGEGERGRVTGGVELILGGGTA